MARYKTLKNISTGEFKDRGSKFIAYAHSAYSETEAKEFIEGIRKEHHKARHVCYSYTIGIEKPVVRINDDGEPSNTGGQPIMNYIKQYELSNVVIAVVRYFGGTLLGKGGLINAYGTAAQEALKAADIVQKSEMIEVVIELPFDDFSKVMDVIMTSGIKLLSEDYSESCKLKVQLEKDNLNLLKEQLASFNIKSIK